MRTNSDQHLSTNYFVLNYICKLQLWNFEAEISHTGIFNKMFILSYLKYRNTKNNNESMT